MTPDEYRAHVKNEYLMLKDWWTKVRGMSDDQVERHLNHLSQLPFSKNSWSYPGEY